MCMFVMPLITAQASQFILITAEGFMDEIIIHYNYINTTAEHVHDVVTDWSYALAGFLVYTLFGVSPGQS